MRRVVLLVFALLGFVAQAEALTVRDIIELSRAGLGEEVLLALIDVDRGVYRIDNATLKSLKDAGVPERVIVALVRSGRDRAAEQPPPPPPPADEPPPAPEPQVVVIDHHEAPQVREVLVPVPIYITVDGARSRYRRSIDRTPVESTYVPFQSGPPLSQPQVTKPAPVYWGFGGKLRPDAWQPHGHNTEKENRRQDSAAKPGDKR